MTMASFSSSFLQPQPRVPNGDKEVFPFSFQSPSTPKAKKRVSFDLASTGQQLHAPPKPSPWPPQTPQKQRISSPITVSTGRSPHQYREILSPETCSLYKPLPITNVQWRLPTPLEQKATRFLTSPRFLQMCAVSIQLANCQPTEPPPLDFVSMDMTPMHPWYASLVTTFRECYARRLRDQTAYPIKAATYTADGTITVEEDHSIFTAECAAHIRSIFRSFHANWHLHHRPILSSSSSENGTIFGSDELNQQHHRSGHHHRQQNTINARMAAAIAHHALLDTLSPAMHPPKAGWCVGDPLHHTYANILRRFEAGILRLIQDRPENTWILTYPDQLARGVSGYKQFFIRSLRGEWELQQRQQQQYQYEHQRPLVGRVGGRAIEEVFLTGEVRREMVGDQGLFVWDWGGRMGC